MFTFAVWAMERGERKRQEGEKGTGIGGERMEAGTVGLTRPGHLRDPKGHRFGLPDMGSRSRVTLSATQERSVRPLDSELLIGRNLICTSPSQQNSRNEVGQSKGPFEMVCTSSQGSRRCRHAHRPARPLLDLFESRPSPIQPGRLGQRRNKVR